MNERIDKLDDRLKVLVKKYPVVTAAVFVIGYIVLRTIEALARWVF